jgi:hypothetical protein
MEKNIFEYYVLFKKLEIEMFMYCYIAKRYAENSVVDFS